MAMEIQGTAAARGDGKRFIEVFIKSLSSLSMLSFILSEKAAAAQSGESKIKNGRQKKIQNFLLHGTSSGFYIY